MHSIPRLITDNENSIQEECESLFLELVLDLISRAGSRCSELYDACCPDSNSKRNWSDLESKLYPEGVLVLLEELSNGEVSPWVKKICSSLGKKKKLKPKIAAALINIIRTSESIWLSRSMPIEKWTAPRGVWFLLSEVSAFLLKAVDWAFLHHHWQLLDTIKPVTKIPSSVKQGCVNEEMVNVDTTSIAWVADRVFLLQTISNVAMELPPEPAADLAQNFLKRLEDFNMHSTEVYNWILYCLRKVLYISCSHCWNFCPPG